jgi:hypothetical protein
MMNVIIYTMMDENGTSHPPNTEKDSQKKKINYAIVITMFILATVLVGFLSYQFLIASQTDVNVLDVEIEVKEVEENIHITSIETTQRIMNLLNSPRSDSLGIFPGIKARVSLDQKVMSYNAFVGYDGEGTYNLVVGFNDVPKNNDILTCAVWIFTGNQGSFADEEETAQIIWGDERINDVIKVEISIQGEYPTTGSDAEISSVKVTQGESGDAVGDTGRKFPGIFAFVLRNNDQGSYIVCESYQGQGNYTLFIGLLFEPRIGEEITVVVSAWQRNGRSLFLREQPPTDSYSTTFVWS